MERLPEGGDDNEHFLLRDVTWTLHGSEGDERIPIHTREDVLAAIPYFLGFHPEESWVAVGVSGSTGSIPLVCRSDLDAGEPAEMADHTIAQLQERGCDSLILVGYGTGQAVAPVIAKMREAATGAELAVREALRVEDGRYWSYIYTDEASLLADGVPYDVETSTVASEMVLLGVTALRGRAELAKLVEPTAGRVPDEVLEETYEKLKVLIRKSVRQAVEVGRQHVQEAVRIARQDGRLDDRQVAWLAATMHNRAVRDDAWARMDPTFRWQHRALWTDVMRRTRDEDIAAPGCLLAFIAWQCGDGVYGNTVLDRVQRADPEYSMARLLRSAFAGAALPSLARLPMTPEEVVASHEADFRAESGDLPPLDFDDPAVRRLYDLPPRPATSGPERENGN